MDSVRHLIVGAGITGLATAAFLVAVGGLLSRWPASRVLLLFPPRGRFAVPQMRRGPLSDLNIVPDVKL